MTVHSRQADHVSPTRLEQDSWKMSFWKKMFEKLIFGKGMFGKCMQVEGQTTVGLVFGNSGLTLKWITFSQTPGFQKCFPKVYFATDDFADYILFL